jgi:hypothetical protein
LAGTNNFAFDEYHHPRPSTEVPQGFQLPAMKAEKESATALRAMLAANGVDLFQVADATTGEPAWGIEFRRAPNGGRIMVALIDMAGQIRLVKIPALRDRALVDLLSSEPVDADNIKLEPLTPRLLETQ